MRIARPGNLTMTGPHTFVGLSREFTIRGIVSTRGVAAAILP